MPETPPLDLTVLDAVVETQIRPLLNVHGGDIDVVSVSEGGHVELEFRGACQSCMLKSVTYAIAVRERLLQFPGVTSVEVHGVNLSAAALDRTTKAYAGYQLMFRKTDTPPAATPPVRPSVVTVPSRRTKAC